VTGKPTAAGRQEAPTELQQVSDIRTPEVVVGRNDVKRAQCRAALLQHAGYRAVPTVAGEQITVGVRVRKHGTYRPSPGVARGENGILARGAGGKLVSVGCPKRSPPE